MALNQMSKKVTNGIWRIIPSPFITEIIAQAGYDFQIFDCEHGAYDYAQLSNEIIACQNQKCKPIVRVSGINKVEVQRCLDLGARGIVFPSLSSFSDFETATKLLDYAPNGTRGFNPFVKACDYGSKKVGEVQTPECITIIETLEAVKQLDKILTLTRIDMFYIGSYDLSAQLNCIGKMDSPKLIKTTKEIIAKVKAKGKKIGILVHDKKTYDYYKDLGVTTFVHSVESFKIKKYFQSNLQEFK